MGHMGGAQWQDKSVGGKPCMYIFWDRKRHKSNKI